LGERGGSFAVVVDGKIFVACPGAPGWTITAESLESDFWAEIVSVKKQTNENANRIAFRGDMAKIKILFMALNDFI
jgi:hypothetical protein